MMWSIIVSNNDSGGLILIVVSVTEPAEFSGNKDDRLTDF